MRGQADPVTPAGHQARALAAAGAGTWQWDRATGVVDWDDALQVLYGLEAGSFGRRFEDWLALVHPDDRDGVRAQVQAEIRHGNAHHLRFRVVRPDGTERWIESRGRVLRDAHGDATGMVGVCYDVTEREEAEGLLRAAEERSRQRLSFLAEAGALLGRWSIDLEATLQELTTLTVPRLADWCVIDLLDRGGLRLAAAAHADPPRTHSIHELVARYGRAPDPGAREVVRTGRLEHLHEIPDGTLRSMTRDEEHLRLLRRLGLASAIVVPLRARGRTLGALTMVHGDSGRRYRQEDVALVADLAGRAAVAIDNASLLAERNRVVSTLQQALLPPALPEPPGVELASRYDPVGQSQIGGDFYDATGAGQEWMLVIGDVCGKGTKAATLTSLARHTVRAAALRNPDPVHVLGLLNDALLEDPSDDSFCTAACAHLTVGEGRARLVVAAGGHPPPLVRRADGTVEQPDCEGMLLGLFEEAPQRSALVELAPGDLVLFYTDGLVEARHGDELFGLARVRAALGDAHGLDAEATLDHVHAVVAAWQDGPRDDTAMLACRLVP